METYKTLDGKEFNPETFSDKEKKFYERVKEQYNKSPFLNEFSNFWRASGLGIWQGKDAEEIVKSSIYQICQDLESRLGIDQGLMRRTEYGDEVLWKIRMNYGSHEKFCKQYKVPENKLKGILNQNKETIDEFLVSLILKDTVKKSIDNFFDTKPKKPIKKSLCDIFIPYYLTSKGISVVFHAYEFEKPREQIKGLLKAVPGMILLFGLDAARIYGYYKFGEFLFS